MKFSLTQDGYVTKYLYTGRKESDFKDISKDTNQLRYEKYLRNIVSKRGAIYPEKEIKLGQASTLGLPWKYYYSYGNIYLDDSAFYVDMKKVELLAVTNLVVEEDMEVVASLWSSSAVDVWVNDELTATIDTANYKPIKQKKMKLKLKKGINRVFVRLLTMGVRDTRISFAIQILEKQDRIKVALPDEESIEEYVEAEEILNSAVLNGNSLNFKWPLPEGTIICYDTETLDFRKLKDKFIREDVSGKTEIELKEYALFRIDITVDCTVLSRKFERVELQKSEYLDTTEESNHQIIYEKIAEVASLIREETDGFAMYPMLARYYLGIKKVEDEEEFKVTLKQIERRMDCADFMTCALIRFLKNYNISDELKDKVKEIMLNFRYWMDEEGQDGMCFWSENHSLMFYQAAYFFGKDYPDDIFIRSNKTGKEMSQLAEMRIREWLIDVCGTGFDEFNSGVYSPITFAALLNLIDYAQEDLAHMAVKAADRLMRMVALHCFKGVVIAPQGRAYRDVLYPHKQALQSIVQYVDRKAPYVYSEWISSMATSKYKMPEDMKDYMNKKGFYSYNSSNAVIDLYKTKDYMLTSVESPRRDGKRRVWEFNMNEEDREHFIYTKSLNECFHGTMQFEPGVLGYQQHMWYAALDPELVVFINHPGQSCEAMTEVRPGYWYGNGIMPALRQEKNILGVVYVIPEDYPIHFTHIFWNESKFDLTNESGNWIFGKKNESYIAVWCNRRMEDHDEVLFHCEKRNYGSKNAYLVVCGSKEDDISFENFKEACKNRKVTFSEVDNTLLCEEFTLTFKAHTNMSQFVE